LRILIGGWFDSMKSILFFTGIYPPDIGGPATFIPQLEAHLDSMGRKFHTITLSDRDGVARKSKPRFSSISRKIPIPIRVLKVVIEGLRIARSKDVIFSNGLYEEASIVSFLSGKPLVSKVVGIPAWEAHRQVSCHGEPLSQGLENFDKKRLPISLRARNMIWEWALRQSSSIVTPSVELACYLNSLGLKTSIKVIENGTRIVNTDAETYEYDVVTTVRLVPWKNVDILILAAKTFDFTLAIVGDGPERSKLAHLASGDERVSFLGALSAESVSRILMSSKIFSLVSSYEGLSFSLIEAWAHGKASVVSTSRGNIDALKNSDVSLRVPIRDVKATGIAIRSLLDNESLRRSKELEALHFVEVHFEETNQLNKIVKEIDGA
jgi:glycosyltransferase involved in cell wall biosynthesis